MTRPWLVRALALLLVIVGLQGGSFRSLDTGHERYYGSADTSFAMRAESRKTEPATGIGQAADLRYSPPLRRIATPVPPACADCVAVFLPPRYRPAPTGPPRA